MTRQVESLNIAVGSPGWMEELDRQRVDLLVKLRQGRPVRVAKPGHPEVYKSSSGCWASVVWTKDPSGALRVPRLHTSHRTWEAAMDHVRRWYASGKTVTW